MIKNVDLGTAFQFNGVLNSSCEAQHQLVVEKGFEKQPIGVLLMLIVSELGEALEADRKWKHAKLKDVEELLPKVYVTKEGIVQHELGPDAEKARFIGVFETMVKDTFEDELADTFLRLMDLCGEYGIDIERHIQLKAAYNQLRPAKHGKAY